MSYHYNRTYTTSSTPGRDPQQVYTAALEEQINSQNETISKQNQKITRQSSEIMNLQSEVDFYKNNMNSNSTQLKIHIQRLENLNNEKVDQINRLIQNEQNLKKINYDLQTEKISLQNKISNLIQNANNQKYNAIPSDELIDNLKYELKCDQKEIADLKVEAESNRNTIFNFEKEIYQVKSKLQDSQTENAQLKEKLARFDTKGKLPEENKRMSKNDIGEFYIREEKTYGSKELEILALKDEIKYLVSEKMDLQLDRESFEELLKKQGISVGDDFRENLKKFSDEIEKGSLKNNKLLKINQEKEILGENLKMSNSIGNTLSEQDQTLYFQGTIVKNRKNGQGVELKENGEHYAGMFQNDFRHGFGKLVTKDFEFIGEFKEDTFDKEKGLFRRIAVIKEIQYLQNVRFEGETLDDIPNGLGTLYFEHGLEFCGKFKSGKIDVAEIGSFKSNGDVLPVSVVNLPDLNIVIFSMKDKGLTWVLNEKTGTIQKS